MKIAILGAGMVGRTIAMDLCKKYQVTSFDVSEQSLSLLSTKAPTVNTIKTDLSNYNNYNALLSDFDFVVTAVPGFMGYNTLLAVIKAKKNVADISFFPEDAQLLHQIAIDNNVTAIVDCGVAPGMSNYILGYYNSKMSVYNFECLVGGLPINRTKPFEYKAPFSPIDVIEEYTRPARIMVNGAIVTRDALSDSELVDFENIGTLESFNTDGLRSILFTMGHIPNMKEKTLRYPGHIDLIKALQKGGFFDSKPINCNGITISPIEFSSAILIDQWKSKPNDEEFTVMKIKVEGTTSDGTNQTIVYDLFDRNDPVQQISSMSRTTGFTCTATLELIINQLFTRKGVFPPELVGSDEHCFNYLMNYLEERGVHYKKTIN